MMWTSIAGVIKILLFFIGLYNERDQARAKKKAELAKEMIDAFEETDKKKQASRLNAVIGGINRM